MLIRKLLIYEIDERKKIKVVNSVNSKSFVDFHSTF